MNAHREYQFLGWTVTLIATIGVAFGAASLAIAELNYGWALFVGVPYFIGFFSSAVLRFWGPRSLRACLLIATQAAAFLALGFLLLGLEGLICILMTLPLALPFILVGAAMGYLSVHRSGLARPGSTAAVLMLALAAALWHEGRHRPTAPTYTVSDAVTIDASAEVVWRALITMGSLGQPPDLLFRLGVACPQRVDIYGTGQGALRVCTLTTGQLQERITSWQPGRELRWVSISTPPPLEELNPFRDIDPPHLHGFYRSVSGQFEFQPVGRDKTLVIRSSSYQHNLFPALYWKLWCDYVARRGHVHVLGVLKQSAEHEASRQARLTTGR
jgi:hypothetical protein